MENIGGYPASLVTSLDTGHEVILGGMPSPNAFQAPVRFVGVSTDSIKDLTKRIGAAVSGIGIPKGVHVIDFRIVVDASKKQSGSVYVIAVDSTPPLQEKTAFDPIEAGRKIVEDMKNAEGGSCTGADLKISPAALHKRRANYGIVYWRDAKSQFHYPKWQFNAAGAMLPGIREVLKAFRSSDEWRVMGYFLTPRRQLGERTPLELLRAGEVTKMLEHAKIHAEENSW